MPAMREKDVKVPLAALGVGVAALLLAQLWLSRLDELAAVLGMPVALVGAATTVGGALEGVRRLLRPRDHAPCHLDEPANGVLVGLIVLTLAVTLFFVAWAL